MKQKNNAIREQEQLDLDKLNSYLMHLEDEPQVEKYEQYTGGASNLTYLLHTNRGEMILRTSPFGTKAKGAHDMSREYTFLKAIQSDFSLAPEAIHLCTDNTITGREFYLMKKLDGTIIRKQLPSMYTQKDCPLLCHELIKVFTQLHSCTTDQLENFNKGPGYVDRQVIGWSKRYSNALTPDVPAAEEVMQWLLNNQPSHEIPYTLIHNDYKFDNVLFDQHQKHQICGVLDWEMATIGDPLMDLGCSLAYWIEATDPPSMQFLKMMPSDHEGMLSRDELVHIYCQQTGVEIGNYDFYYIFGLFRLAAIVQQIYYRYYQGQSTNPQFKSFGTIASILIQQAQEHIK